MIDFDQVNTAKMLPLSSPWFLHAGEICPVMMKHNKRVAVLMLGEALRRKGGVVAVEKLILKHMPEAIHFIHISTLEDGTSFRKLLVFTKAIVKQMAHLMTKRIDLVHIHVSTGGSVYRKVLCILIARVFAKPVILHAHSGKFPAFFARQPRFFQSMIAFVFRQCDRLVAVSPHWQGFYAGTLGIDPDKINILPNPVALPASIPQRDAASTVELVFFGLVCEAKGVFDLLQAIKLINGQTKSTFRVTIAGHGDVDKARSAAGNLGVDALVDFTGWVDSQMRDALLAKADIFLLPSHFEGLPMALLEAMSWGLPCITTPVGGIPDIVDDGVDGLLRPVGDVEALADAMRQLIDDPVLRQRLGKAARRRIEPLDVGPYADNLDAIYRHLAA